MTVQEAIVAARAAWAAKDFAAACDAIEGALAEHPGSSDLLLWRVRLAAKRGDWATVSAAATEYQVNGSPNADVFISQARALYKVQDIPRAARAWAAVTELRPDFVEGWRQAASLHSRCGNEAAALVSVAALAKLARRDPAAASVALVELANYHQFVEAAALCAHLSAENPTYLLEHYRELDGATESSARLAVLAAAALQATGKAPDEVGALIEALLVSGVRHDRSGDWTQAYADFTTVLLVQPDEMLARRGAERVLAAATARARTAVRTGDEKEALSIWRALYRFDPANRPVVAAYGKMLRQAGSWEAAVDLWRVAVAADPTDRAALVAEAHALEALDRIEEAAATWNRLASLDPEDASAVRARTRLSRELIQRGRVAFDEGLIRDAAQRFSAVPEQAAERPDALRRLQQVGRGLLKDMREAYKRGDYNAVVASGLSGRDWIGDHPDFHRLLAKGAARSHQHQVARLAWERAAAASSDHVLLLEAARYHLGRSDPERAAVAARRARELSPSIEAAKMLTDIEQSREAEL